MECEAMCGEVYHPLYVTREHKSWFVPDELTCQDHDFLE